MKKTVSKKRRLLQKRKYKEAIKSRRPSHKRFLLHPVTVFMLLCAGVLMLGWTWKAGAADYTVKAKVPAAPLTKPAEIINPKNGDHFKTKPIDVTGTCPYQSYVELYRNDVFSGVAICNPDSTFALSTDLSAGVNILQARVFNVTDDEGPPGQPVTIYYDPPQPPQQITPVQKTGSKPFNLSSEYKYEGYGIDDEISWQITVTGSSGPFAFNVKWGDGSDSNYVQRDAGQFDIRHRYGKAGIYNIKVQGVDIAGSQAFLQLTAVVVKYKNAMITGTFSNGQRPPLNLGQQNYLVWLWPTYAIVVAMAFSFWLGERQEYYLLTRKNNRRLAR